ncbi:mRNA decay activator protein ZFP36L1-like [Seriola lalandi dorsalis]|uniref:mRNA decay activator protein ZFP36 n=1 Tax=Seriola lalandi dorsalis TaxID=1841481 RepID=A0A3B4WZN0_SERLL|nr:mRNA decay activator protein ZFP36L1-like [Seriola lalandi dorsalis]XP_056231193.1 mRNA decay activator protein ZFP36L1 [Seriola aureovittata]
MPSYPKLIQFADLEEMMCKQLLNLDLRESDRRLPSRSLAMGTPGYNGQPRSNTSFSLSSLCLPTDPNVGVFLTSSQRGQQSESWLPSQLSDSSQWGKSGFLAQRSVSMIETSSTTAASLGWPGTDIKHSQSDISPTALNASSSSSTSSISTSSSSSRYKTELCRSFTENGLCKYGGKCQFAHGPEELRDLNRHPKYKTEPCRTFHTIGFCPYGIRCHFVHNSEEEKKHSSRSSSSSSSSSSSIPQQPPCSSHTHRPPLVRQSFSFAGFPSAPQQALQHALSGHPPPATASFTPDFSASPPSCADITDLLSHAFLEMDSAFEASTTHQYQPPMGHATAADLQSPFLPSPDSGCSPCGLSPTGSPSLRQSPSATGVFSGPLGARSLSYTSLSDQDQDGSSSACSLSGSESCGGINENNARRLAVFSQLSVP